MNRSILLALIALAAAVASLAAWFSARSVPMHIGAVDGPPATTHPTTDSEPREANGRAADRAEEDRSDGERRAAPGLAAWLRELLGDEPPSDPDVGLPTASITGRLAWAETFLPVEGARVRLQRHSRDTVVPEPGEDLVPPADDPATTTRTDRYGKFVLANVPVRENLFLRFELDDGTAEVRDVRTLPAANAQTWQGEYLLEPRGTLVGRVVGPGGAPLGAVRLRAVDELRFDDPAVPWEIQEARIAGAETVPSVLADGRRPRDALQARQRLLPFPTATTRADGTFTIHGIREGDANLVLQHDALVGRRLQVPIVAGRITDIGTLALERGTPFVVRVVDPERRPLAGVLVAATPAGWKFGSPPRRTDADGLATFRLNVAPGDEGSLDGGVEVSVRRSDRVPWSEFGSFGLPGREIVLEDARDLDVRVDVFGGSTGDLAQDEVRFTTRPKVASLRWSGSNGSYRIRGLPPEQSVALGAVAAGFAPGVALVLGQRVRSRALRATDEDVAAEEPPTAPPPMPVLTLVPTFPVRVQVVDDAMQPLAGARMSFTPGRPRRWQGVLGTEWPQLIRDVFLGVTGADGTVLAEGLWDTEVRFTASHPHRGALHLVVQSLAPDQLIVIKLPALARVTGQIVEDGAAVTRRYRVRLELPRPMDQIQLHPYRDPVEVVSNDSGAFELPQVGAGDWRLTVIEPSLPDAGPAFREHLGTAPYLSRALPLDPGTHVDLTLDLTPERRRAFVAGTVTLGGEPTAGLRVEIWEEAYRPRRGSLQQDGWQRLGAATTDARGAFAIRETSWQNVELRVLVPRRGTAVPVVRVPLHLSELRRPRREPIAIDVPVGDLALELRDADGRALANRPIRLVGDRGAYFLVVADRDGVVREARLPAGRYEIVAAADDGSRLEFEAVEVQADRATTTWRNAAR